MVLCHLQRRPPGWLGPCKRLVIAGGLRKQPFGPPSCLGAAGAAPVAPGGAGVAGYVHSTPMARLQASTAPSSPSGSAARPLRGDSAAPALRAAIHRDRVTSAREWRAAAGRPRSRRRTGRRAGSPSGVARRPGRRRPRSPQPGLSLLIRRYIFGQKPTRAEQSTGTAVPGHQGDAVKGLVASWLTSP